MRKFATTQARSSGCSKDDTDAHTRWKGQKRQQDDYANITIPFVDAKVAAALCKGGPCCYAIVGGTCITDDWILDYVVPHIWAHCNREISLVLGKALLWKIYDDDDFVPQEIRTRVSNNAYRDLEHGIQSEKLLLQLKVGIQNLLLILCLKVKTMMVMVISIRK